MNRVLWIALSRIKGLGGKRLLALHGESISQDELRSLKAGKILGDRLFHEIDREGFIEELLKDTEYFLGNLKEKGIEVVTFLDECYSESLKSIQNPPVVLYCKGDTNILNHPKKIAIVGTRCPTKKGLNETDNIARKFASEGYAIVSGLAAGIDTAAHKAALMSGGLTIAVLPCSLDNVYPASNISLAREILIKGGLLITEYPPKTILQKRHFVERDRIQSGLSSAIIVVQTEINGGAMHTANFSRKQGRLVFCPEPEENNSLKQYNGIIKLLDEGNAIKYPRNVGEVEKAIRRNEQLTL